MVKLACNVSPLAVHTYSTHAGTSKVEVGQCLQSQSDTDIVPLWVGGLVGQVGGQVLSARGTRMLHLLVQQNHVQHLQQAICVGINNSNK